MRNAFADEVTTLAGSDERVVMLSADIGNRLFDRFRERHAGRFYNCGIAEANMISLAAGLASCGLRPVCYTITPFITARCFEQIRVDVAYHEMPVIIVGTGAGLSYASLGSTHHSLEDITLLRSLPGMNVLAPADAMELRSCLRAALRSDNPTYMRIGKKGEPVVFAEPPEFELGVWRELREGDRVCLLAAGTVVSEALAAADSLAQSGIGAAVYSCASVKPLDEDTLAGVTRDCDIVATIEEHGLIGGFGAAVAEWVVDRPAAPGARIMRFGAADRFIHESVEQEGARSLFGLTAPQIAESIARELVAVA